MRFKIRHVTRYDYESEGRFAVQRLKLTPTDNRAQKVISWRIEAPGIAKAACYVDGFGNVVHLATHNGAYDSLSVIATGEVETTDTGGILGDVPESANPRLFMRETPLTGSSPDIDAMVDGLPEANIVPRLHLLLDAIASRVAYVTDTTDAATSAAEAFAAGQGVCQDHAHIFIAAVRRLDIPARYATGYLYTEGEQPASANHAWAEAFVPGLGWVGFDPANAICPTDRYIRLASGFDAHSAAPIIGTRRGGGTESLTVDVLVQQQQQ